ncbi:MAG: hypothetical protein B7Y73_04835 [Acidocella sp. 35-58-6]|nr:MAG: hypothetical protein B7Y73_04835 [Acidocella sp. 35-58-6]
MNARRWLVGGGFAVALVAGVVWWFVSRESGPVIWQGYAEGDFVLVGPTQQGLLTKVAVQRGDRVAQGALLFAQDATFDSAARDQAAQVLAGAQAQLANLLAGGKATEIAQAQAQLAAAQATATQTSTDYQRGLALLHTGAVSKQSVDQLQAAYLSAQAKLAATQAALAQSQQPLGRAQEIADQRTAVAADQAALAMAEWRLAQRVVSAPVAGRVADVLAQPGETMQAGAPVVSLLPPGNIFVRFFVPEAAVSSVHLGDGVALHCDGCAADLTAKISFISPQAEYTPPLIYSDSSKSKLVFLIEARPSLAQASSLNPGEPVEVQPVTVPPAAKSP